MRLRPTIASIPAMLLSILGCGANGDASLDPQAVSHGRGNHVTASCNDPFAGARVRFDPSEWKTDFCRHAVPYGEIRSGGPPRDGIPPIDDPKHVGVDAADRWLDDTEPVLMVEVGGTSRAYPLQILMWHEIVNDRIAGTPVAVTFCPLCYAAIVFERPRLGGRELTFGTTGNLRRSDLVMWDRQTESWWQQYSGKAVVGELTGRELRKIPSSIVAWGTFRRAHPDALVLSRDTGVARPYGQNPYVGYDDVDNPPFAYDGPLLDGLEPMDRIVAVEVGAAKRAYPLGLLRKRRLLEDALGEQPIVLFWEAGVASAVDAPRVEEGKDIGQTGVFHRRLDGRELTFRRGKDGSFVDARTRSSFNVLGRAEFGPLAGRQLESIVHHDTFWFVWSAFAPDGDVYRASERTSGD